MKRQKKTSRRELGRQEAASAVSPFRLPAEDAPRVSIADEADTTPDWGSQCEVCDAVPTVPLTGLCGPCTFGEASTANGNW